MGGESKSNIGAAAAVLAGLLPAAALVGLVVLLLTVLNPQAGSACPSTPAPALAGGGEWLATAYGPPWGGIQGEGVTATGINLRPAKHAYIVAVDPSVIPLGSYVHVVPNPFGNDRIAFLAGDTGGAIIGKHVDIYDWMGRAAQDAWGARKVTVTPARNTSKAGAAQLLEATPTPQGSEEGECGSGIGAEGPLQLTAGQRAVVNKYTGLAEAPAEAPQAVKEMIAAGNRLHRASYLYGGAHGTSLNTLQPAYDCSSATSYVLHGGHVFGEYAWDSGELEQYGEPGPGKWVSVYANEEHAFMFVAGLRFDTVYYYDDGPNAGKHGPRWRVYPEVPPGKWVVRHPPGL